AGGCMNRSCHGRGGQELNGKTGKPGRGHYAPPIPEPPAASHQTSDTSDCSLQVSDVCVRRRGRYRPLPAYRPFPLHTLPPVLCDVVPATAEAIGCDPALIAIPALAVVAGCIGNARAVVLKRGWIEPAVVC